MAKRGLTMIEVLVSMVLMALVVWSMQVLYVGLMSGTRLADNHQEVTAALKTTIDFTRLTIRQAWPATNPPDPPSTYSGVFEQYTYDVADQGRQKDPLDPGGTTYIDLKLVDIELFYYQPDTGELRSQKATISVSR